MNKKLVSLLTVATLSVSFNSANAQQCTSSNLLINGDFNDYTQLPTAKGELDYAVDWFPPSGGSTDYFYENNYTGLPDFVNTISPDGGGFAGFHSSLSSNFVEYYEYAANKPTTPLLAGQTYTV